MSALSARDRFLARTEVTEVRIPFDRDAVTTLRALQDQRDKLAAEFEEAKASTKRRLSDPTPVLDVADLDEQIAAADAALDAVSILVVLRWQRDVYREEMDRARRDDVSLLAAQINVVSRYYECTKALEDGAWVDIDLSWDDLAARLNEGEMSALGRAATDLALATDAAPFRTPTRTSATT